jgi:hypothetical protein
MGKRKRHWLHVDLCFHNRLRVERHADHRHRRTECIRSAPGTTARACPGGRRVLRARGSAADLGRRCRACENIRECADSDDGTHHGGDAILVVVWPESAAPRMAASGPAGGRRRAGIFSSRCRPGGRLHLSQSACLSGHGPLDGVDRCTAAGGLSPVVRRGRGVGERSMVHGIGVRRAFPGAAVLEAAGVAGSGCPLGATMLALAAALVRQTVGG